MWLPSSIVFRLCIAMRRDTHASMSRHEWIYRTCFLLLKVQNSFPTDQIRWTDRQSLVVVIRGTDFVRSVGIRLTFVITMPVKAICSSDEQLATIERRRRRSSATYRCARGLLSLIFILGTCRQKGKNPRSDELTMSNIYSWTRRNNSRRADDRWRQSRERASFPK